MDEDGAEFLEIIVWENPNSFSRRRIKSKIDLKKIGVDSEDGMLTMECSNSIVVVGSHTGNWYPRDGGAIRFISLSTGKQEKNIGLVDAPMYLEFLSDNVLMGLSGPELQRNTKFHRHQKILKILIDLLNLLKKTTIF